MKKYITNYYAEGSLKDKDIDQIDSVKVLKLYICSAKFAVFDDYFKCLGTTFSSIFSFYNYNLSNFYF